MALPGVLAIMAALLIATGAWFEAAMTEVRGVDAFAARSVAFHAAQAALDACERRLGEVAVRTVEVAPVSAAPSAPLAVMPTPAVTLAGVTAPKFERAPELAPGFVPAPGRAAEREREPEPEPAHWRQPAALDHAPAWQPFASWPGAAAPPSCLIEPWTLDAQADRQTYLLTSRGFGTTRTTVVWMQRQIARHGGRTIERRWRQVAALP
ncbi:MAG: hypothetical protein GAK40_01397 [Burkholderia plantarii]|nr:MAG: hypothetical protein GAK40_01397 [Burkholderia plantarii]